MNMTTESSANPVRQSEKKSAKSQLVVVELAKARSTEQVRRLRKGRGRLVEDIEDAVEQLIKSGTIKAENPPVVIVVREAAVPLLWALDYDANDEDYDEHEDEEDEDEDDEDDD
jgi:hypothetical protein